MPGVVILESEMNIESSPLEWVLKVCVVVSLLISCRHCVRVGEYRRNHERCQFPSFLQSKAPGYGDWTWKYGGATHVGKVHGSIYTICSKVYSKEISGHVEETCPDNQKSRICIKKHGNRYAVQHGEDRPKFQCIEFIERSRTVIQLALSDIDDNASTICSHNMTLDHSPWISVKHSVHGRVNCPFVGGYNFHEILEFSKDHQLQKTECKGSLSTDEKPVVRIESDCVDKEGIKLNFREDKCVPARSYFALEQRLVCIASWEMDSHGFAVLRKDMGEFAFFCIRVEYSEGQVSKIVLYVDWECYRATDLSSPDGKVRLGYSTSYAEITNCERHLFSIPCKPGVKTCSELIQERHLRRHHPDFQHYDQQQHDRHQEATATCQHCLNDTGQPCDMNHVTVNTWTVKEPYSQEYNLTILPTSVNHPHLGTLHCVTFDPRQQVNLRSILWAVYQNGCYPRFMCMYYDTPSVFVLRYKFSNILQWPVTLNEEEICHDANFKTQPDFHDPKDTIKHSLWQVAYAQDIRHRPCVIPSWLPDSASFTDHWNRSGCITFRSQYLSRKITVRHVEKFENSSYLEFTFGREHQFYCVAALTYLTTYKTIITVTHTTMQETGEELFCWMFVDSLTVVVIKTSSCNKETADRIIAGDAKSTQHLHWMLRLHSGDQDVRDDCQRLHNENQERQMSRVETAVRRPEESKRNRAHGLIRSYHRGHAITMIVTLCINLSLFLNGHSGFYNQH